MIPNRVSYGLDFKGPSYTVDSACSSSGIAFCNAFNDLTHNKVDAALVTGVQINSLPETLRSYIRAGIISPTGQSVPFDSNADGMIRSEGITAIFLQKAKFARRVYAKVCAANCYAAGFNSEGITVPSLVMQKRVMRKSLDEANVDIKDIDYVEAHATGTNVGDPIELNAMADFYCENRKKPLYIGSIKSNLGHTEASSANCGIIKSIIAFEEGLVPPNINYKNPNPHCPALLEGKLVVVTDPLPFDKEYIPVKSMGFGGSLVEMMLKRNPRSKSSRSQAAVVIPRLVLYPATTEEAINFMFEYIHSKPDLPQEFFALVSQLSFTDTFLKSWRGYTLFEPQKSPITQTKNITSTTKRPLWFVMTGMGCQWSGMGLQLMQLDVFAESMNKSAALLRKHGIDLFKLLSPGSNYLLEDRKITAPFVGICSIQIALIDLLRHLGIEPDGMVGHSVGELICAYADGCINAEETLLAAYFRGRSVEDSDFPSGGMAAVGLSWEEVKKRCPKGVYAACNNADDSVTISGRTEPLNKFVQTLEKENVFVRLVNSLALPFHCELVQPAVPLLEASMSKIITNPKKRSSRWLSSSYPESEWDTPDCVKATAQYFVHNLRSNVLFNEVTKKIPRDAIIIEIGPHFLLQSILKRTIGSQASYFGLMKKNEEDSITFLLDTLGKLYSEGLNPKIEKLYPPVKFPVPRGTPCISDLIRWNHSMTFDVPKYTPKSSQFEHKFGMDRDDAYLVDHRIDGKSLFPATGYICLAWEALEAKLNSSQFMTPFVLQNFKIHRATIISPQAPLIFVVNILDSTGRFEILENKSLVASGEVFEVKKMVFDEADPSFAGDEQNSIDGKEVYSELKMCGYEYGPHFQGLEKVSTEGTSGSVQWRGKWIPFLDSLLLFSGMITSRKDFRLPTGAHSIKIDPSLMKKATSELSEENSDTPLSIPVRYHPKTGIIRSLGVEICCLDTNAAPLRPKLESLIWEEYRFVPYDVSYDPSDKNSDRILQYFSACDKAMKKIGEALKVDVKKHLFSVDLVKDLDTKDFLTDDPENSNLLKALISLSEDTVKDPNRRKEVVSSYTQGLGKDILNNLLLNEDSLRLILEIIIENSHKKLNIAEVNDNFPVVLVPFSEMLQKYFHMKFKKSVLITKGQPVVSQGENVLEENNIQSLPGDHLELLAAERQLDAVIGSFTSGSDSQLEQHLRTLKSCVKPNGFILLFFKEKIHPAEEFLFSLCKENVHVQSQKVLEKVLSEQSISVISKTSDPFGGWLYLLRSPLLETVPSKVLRISESDYNWVEEVKSQLSQSEAATIWLLAEDSPCNGVIGMVNCLKQEPNGERIRCVFIPQKNSEKNLPTFSVETPFYREQLSKNLVMNVWKDGTWGSFRHILIGEEKLLKRVDHSYGRFRKIGDLSSIGWFESNVKYARSEGKTLVHICYSALNFRDVMLATGKISSETSRMGSIDETTTSLESSIGFEFSGIDSRGRRVCGMTKCAGIATEVLTDNLLTVEVPEKWTLQEAATVFVVYVTAYYALLDRGRLQKGERVLIHSGTGGVGIAAIKIALSMGCEIFTTVGSDEKRKYLQKMFPQIKSENIGCSRDTSFKHMILNRTDGKGVDVVLNSLADDKFQATIGCVAYHGRFVEIGMYDLSLDRPIGTKVFLKNISFHGVFLNQLLADDDASLRIIRNVMKLMNEGFRTGVVQPLPATVFEKNDIEEAFRYMGKGVHVGKVLIKIRDDELAKKAPQKPVIHLATPRTYFYGHKVYIVVGGLGGFGIELTKWMLGRGARNIILTSRYGARTPYHFLCLNRWKAEGANIQVSTLNVCIKNQAEQLLRDSSKIGPVAGIINSAVVLHDAFMESQTTEKYQEVCSPKAVATRHLDELSRKLCPSLDLFVCFSSISCGRGNAGQSNYGFANSVMERVCEERKAAGLHGLAIQWGIIGEVGVFHRHFGDDANIAGIKAQSVTSCLQSFDFFCRQDCPVVTSYVSETVAAKKAAQVDALSHLARMLGVEDISLVNPTRTFSEMGIDSMLRVELKQLLESYLDTTLSITDIQDMKIDDVKALLEKASSETSDKGPSLFITEVVKFPPELHHKEPVVVLSDSQDYPGAPVFIINIGDEDVTNFRMLAKTLKKKTYGLVWCSTSPMSDIESVAAWYLKVIRNITSGPFHLMGHSLGGSVAFEMALQCQKLHKNLQSIRLLSGSEDLLSSLNNDSSEKKDPEVKALTRFVSQFVENGIPRLEEDLTKSNDSDQRTAAVLNRLTGSSNQNMDKNDIENALSNFVRRFNIIHPYIPREKLNMDISILENPTKVLPNDVTTLKETFLKVSSGKITIERKFIFNKISTKEDAELLVSVLQ